MVSRAKSNASQRPRPRARRAKTTPNLRSYSSAQNSETDRKHALIAADLAYERVYGRGVAILRGVGDQEGQVAKKRENDEDRPRLERRQSIRFAGPNAEPTRTRSITRREVPGYRTSQEIRRQSLQPQAQSLDSPSRIQDESFLTALPEEFGENDIASAPSSYRKLRKAKSMFSPGKAPSAIFPNGTSKPGRHFQRHSRLSSEAVSEPVRPPDPRLRRSFSFLRGVTDRINTTNSRQYATQDAAIQLARDTYLQQLEQQRLKEQPSFLNLSRHRTKAFRRTIRSSSTNTYDTAIGSSAPSEESTKVRLLGFKAHKLSQNLKTKIKRVFQRSNNDKSTIPVQQLNASHAHYGHFRSISIGSDEQQYSPLPEPNAELLRRVGSRESIENSIPLCNDNRPGRGSFRNLHDENDESKETSRVSSWTNSTANNTFIMPHTMERKRLSVIKEDGGPHQPSSSARVYGGQRDGYAGFRQPISQTDLQGLEAERVFSALQREIEDNRRRIGLEDIESGTESSSGQQGPRCSVVAPRRSSSLRRHPILTLDSTTQRPEIEASINGGAGEMLQQPRDGGKHRECQQNQAELAESLTRLEIAEMNDSSKPLAKRPLHEVTSAFFPSSMRIERSNISPFRRAMKASNEDEDDVNSEDELSDQINSPDLLSPTNARIRTGSVAGPESVYSRSPGGHIGGTIGSDISLARSQGSDVGTAIINIKGAAKYDSPRYSSAGSSGDWKKFMATQVVALENRSTSEDGIFNAFPVKESGHKRESAQIDGDDRNVSGLETPSSSLNQPLGVILGNTNTQPPLHRKGSHPTAFNSSPSWTARVQNENTPISQPYPYPYKSSNIGNGTESPSSTSGQLGGLRERTSCGQQAQSNGQQWLSTSPNMRNSPERAERLRRLKNNSTPSLRKTLTPNENHANCNSLPRNIQAGRDDSDGLDVSPVIARSHAISDKEVMNSYLKDRRSYLKVSGESVTGPAFI